MDGTRLLTCVGIANEVVIFLVSKAEEPPEGLHNYVAIVIIVSSILNKLSSSSISYHHDAIFL